MVPHLLSMLSVITQPGYACPGKGVGGHGDDACPGDAIRADADPAASARRADLVGSEACAWTTGAMAARVLDEGTPWTVVGRLAATANALPSKVAAPYTLGPDAQVHVIANTVLEKLQATGLVGNRLEFTGRLLEVDGTTYFVATEVSAARS
jgi:hypothetical protein